MYGVVLWSDREQDRAVIWCEDHGDLAFYRGEGNHHADYVSIGAGDLVAFDLCEATDMRLARAPRLVAQESHPTLTRALRQAGRKAGVFPDTHSELPAPDALRQGARPGNVVPFRSAAMAG